jgi:hypothetical protein
MRDRIWKELTQAKFNCEFASLYADKQRTSLRYFNICILVFSSGGVMGWSFWNGLPLLSCGIIAGISLLRLIQPHIIMSDKQISNLDNISRFYFNYYNKLERLWYDLEHKTLDNESCKNLFFEVKQSEDEINQIINETIRSKPKKIVAESKINSDTYFKLTFNT